MTPDVNILLAAARADHPHHHPAHTWLTGTLASVDRSASLALFPVTVASFLRLVTNARIFVQPSAIDDALSYVDALLSRGAVLLHDQGSEWPVFRRLCAEKRLAGNAIPDAWLAACVLHTGEHLVTFDAGFRRLLPRSQLTVLSGV